MGIGKDCFQWCLPKPCLLLEGQQHLASQKSWDHQAVWVMSGIVCTEAVKSDPPAVLPHGLYVALQL